ncbi:MAG: UDP-3-O-(3-hydroxymyristoyl)glucosamine N-acyltransferase, partial [Acetobacteraceae bacterium]|nr:UDP-3-O-(3-hydroxymyristoyl)glucosamine N-acyltransferase [Acetobacteraceae bacterium]
MTAGDQLFFQRSGPYSLARVAEAADGQAPADSTRTFVGVAPLQTARAEHVSFLHNRRYLFALRETTAGAVLLPPNLAAEVPAGTIAISTHQPHVAWAKVCALFHPLPPLKPGIHPSAIIEDGAQIDPTAEIGPLAFIGAGAEIGASCRISVGAVIGTGVVIGADSRIGALTCISHALIGRRVMIHPGVRIGQEGFGFATPPTGFLTIPQLGRVIIGDDVDIGANTTIDRGS